MISAPLSEQYRDYLMHANGGSIEISGLPEALSGYGVLVNYSENNGYLPEEMYSIVQYLFDKRVIETYNNSWKASLPTDTL